MRVASFAWSCALLLAVAAAACTGAAQPPLEPDAADVPPGPVPEPPGPEWGPECAVAADCTEKCEFIASVYRDPQPGYDLAFENTSCGPMSVNGQPATVGCNCPIAGQFGFSMALMPGQGLGCLWYGRAHTCVYQESEFPGCDPEVARSCDGPCGVLAERLKAEAATEIPTTVHGIVCNDYCQCVLDVDGACHVNYEFPSYDCALSAEEIVAAHEAGGST